MIIVIADDITGAAEMAGIGLRYGLNVIVSNDIDDVDVDLLVIYTNTRSMRVDEAVRTVEKLTSKARDCKPSLFYRKTDSVLRGHVLAEIRAQMDRLGVKAGLLVPVNPSLGRIIRDGTYYVDGHPIHETGFADDPEFPVGSANVSDMLGDANVAVVKPGKEIRADGVSVGEAVTNEDVEQWAQHFCDPILFAGGATYFLALLARMYPEGKASVTANPWSLPLLLVSGTTYPKNVQRLKQYAFLVSYMPATLFSGEAAANEIDSWAGEAGSILSRHQRAIIAVGDHGRKGDASWLRQKTAEVVKEICSKNGIRELLIEGGSTAFAVIQELGWRRFEPVEELRLGIVRMKVAGERDIHLTIKPGSYDWPPKWNLLKA